MKAMPLPFEELQGKGVLDFTSVSDLLPHQHHLPLPLPQKWITHKDNCYVGIEPTSVLDARRSPSPPTSTSTLSSPLGGRSRNGGGGGTGSTDTTVPTAAALPENLPALEKCGLGMDDWDSVLSESSVQEHSILRLIMGDIEDPSMGLNKLLQSGSGSHQDMEFPGNFGSVDQGFVFELNGGAASLVSNSNIDSSFQGPPCSDIHFDGQNILSNNARVGSVSNTNPMFSSSANHHLPVSLGPGMLQHQQHQFLEAVDEKPQLLNTQLLMSQNQAQFSQNQSMFMPLTYAQLQEHHLLLPPPAKRLNSGTMGTNYQFSNVPYGDSEQEMFARRQQQQQQQPQVQLFPHLLPQRPTMALMKQNMVNDELVNQQFQQGIIDQLMKAAELIEAGNPVLAQGILARLNHQLSPVGKPFQRAAFYFKEALLLLLNMNTANPSVLSPISLIFKIGAYKSFSEVSPVLNFSNFTCNQALLEALDGYDRIHIIDFDIGHGGQWASLMQEFALRNGGSPFLKITAFTSTHDEFELGFTQENLKQFANDLNIGFEIEILGLESFNSGSWPLPLPVSENKSVAVNLPATSFSNSSFPLPLVLRFIKHLSPKLVVSLDRGCDRIDAPFPHYIINGLKYCSGLLESLDAVNMNLDVQQKIERYLLQPVMEKIVVGRLHLSERMPSWRTLFLSSGFSPLTFSNFTETQAECLVQRSQVRGFYIEKRQASLVLCWQQKELVSVSAWRC